MHSKFVLRTAALCVGLFLAMMLFLEIGRQLGLHVATLHGEAAKTGLPVAADAVYWVFALLLGFTFSGAMGRFDKRRDLIAKQVTATSTAWHRVDALPADVRPAIRDGFRRYLDALLAAYAHAEEPGSPEAERLESDRNAARNDLWAQAVTACTATTGEKARMLLLPSLNEMFDAMLSERLARRTHPPGVIWVMLVVSALAASTLAGFSMANETTRNWLYHIGIAGTISVVMYVIIEIEYPRLGLVRVDAFDQVLKETRAAMK